MTTTPPLAGRPVDVLRAVVALAALLFVVGLFLAPEHVWPSFLVALQLLLGAGLAGALFIALHYVTGARWSTGIRRVAEAMTASIPLAAGGMVVLAFGTSTLYDWTHEALVVDDAVLSGRSQWMNLPFFFVRAILCFGAWILLSQALVRHSQAQDVDHDPAHRASNVKRSVVFLVVFAFTFSLAMFDWTMSLERHWFSTIFAVYQFSGLLLSGLGLIALLVVSLRRRGVLGVHASDDVLHDLGKLVFGFSLFWGYIWFSQYMLIWYANLPEETTFYATRHAGAWEPLSIANVALNWAIPFVVLMPRKAKRNPRVLARVAVVLLCGRWLDLYLTVQPALTPAAPEFSIWAAALPVGAAAVFVLSWNHAFGRAAPLPVGDEALARAVHGT